MVVPRLEIYLGEHLCTMELVKQLISPRQWITIFHCLFIKVPIVHAHSQRALFFLDKQYRRPIRTLGRPNPTFEEQLIQLLPHFFELQR